MSSSGEQATLSGPRDQGPATSSAGISVPRPFQPAPEMQALLDQFKIIGNDLDNLTHENLAAARSIREQRAQRTFWNIPVETVREVSVPGDSTAIPARLYIPEDKQLARKGKLPLVIYFHGGGWVLGSPNIYDSITRLFARQIPALVLSVDYRLAPENPFPAAWNDALAVLRWAREHGEELGADPTRIVVAGDSAGGTLATALAMQERERNGPPLILQLLFYPSTHIASMDFESYRQYGKDHLLTQKAVESFRQFYLPNPSDWTRPQVSPLLAEDFKGMPPALIILAGCDVLRDEGEAYARKLRANGVEVILRLEPNLIHGFLNLYNIFPPCSPYAEGVIGYAAGVIRSRCMTG